MNSIKISVRRAGSLFAVAALVLSSAVPGLASAANITERSVTMSSSARSAVGVTYEVAFNAETDSTGAFAVDFCTTPDIGSACTAPTGFSIGTVSTTSDHTVSKSGNTVKVVLDEAVDDGDPIVADISGFTNPSAAGVFYARIVTYTDGDTNYHYTNAETLGSYLDAGTVAMSIANGFSVDGAVLEQLTFCVSGDEETDCTDPDTIVGSLGADGVLGTTVGDDVDVYSYIATNAAGGAVVRLKSDAAGCGGLLRQGVGTPAERCGIAPLTTGVDAILDNAAAFGAKLTLLQPAGGTNGTLALVGNWGTNYYMNYDDDGVENEGVTSPYGDPIYTTSDAPTAFGGGQLSFNANRSDLTPAGNYSANFSLIATGKF